MHKPFIRTIERIYQAKAEDLLMLGFVDGMMQADKTINTSQAIQAFLIYFEVSEDEWPFDSARVQYYDMKKRYYDKLRAGDPCRVL